MLGGASALGAARCAGRVGSAQPGRGELDGPVASTDSAVVVQKTSARPDSERRSRCAIPTPFAMGRCLFKMTMRMASAGDLDSGCAHRDRLAHRFSMSKRQGPAVSLRDEHRTALWVALDPGAPLLSNGYASAPARTGVSAAFRCHRHGSAHIAPPASDLALPVLVSIRRFARHRRPRTRFPYERGTSPRNEDFEQSTSVDRRTTQRPGPKNRNRFQYLARVRWMSCPCTGWMTFLSCAEDTAFRMRGALPPSLGRRDAAARSMHRRRGHWTQRMANPIVGTSMGLLDRGQKVA